tara:strand:+ start:2937 stop:3821 length:885 start_codon:yes stop_codon:yes gene_type:complete
MDNFMTKQINADYSNLKTFVINLDDYIKNFNKQKPFLDKIGLPIERFSGINALKDEHIEYNNIITKYAKNFSPKSVIGCSLSHILCCKHIYNEFVTKNSKYDYYLMMEDDVFPLYDKNEFLKVLNINLFEITLLDKNWDIIQLHSDAFFPTYKTYITHYATGSTAAYLISNKGIKKMIKEKVRSHLDFETQNFIRYNKYRVKKNLFYTNEKNSLNRFISNDKYTYYNMSLYLKSKLLQNFKNYIPLRGEKVYANFLEFKLLRLPYINKEYTANEIIDYFLGAIILKKIIKRIKY